MLSALNRRMFGALILATIGCAVVPPVPWISQPSTPTATGVAFADSGPLVTAVSPSSGKLTGATSVTISGSGFTGSVAVTFGSRPAVSVRVVSPTRLVVKTPEGASPGSVQVRVTAAGGSSGPSAGSGFTYTPVAPSAPRVVPGSGPLAGGTVVVLSGKAFIDVQAVTFGGIAAVGWTRVSATQITATAPPGMAGRAEVRVTTSSGRSAAGAFTYSASSPNVRPVVGGLTPTSAGPGSTVTVSGAGFVGVSAVRFGSASSSSVTVVSAGTLRAVVPAGSGSVDVTVVTPSGVSAAVSASRFSYLPLPTVTGLSPSTVRSAGGTSVTISGSGLAGATSVTFGGVAASSFTVLSSTQISAVVPPGTGTVDALVATVAGTSPAGPASKLTYAPVPTIAGLVPNSGPVAGGSTVTITGSGLAGVSSVLFGGVAAASFVPVSDSEVRAVVPANAAPTTVDVRVTTPGGTSPIVPVGEFRYAGAPSVTGLAPTSGAGSGGTKVFIVGDNLSTVTGVFFGSSPARSFTIQTVMGSTFVEAIAPSGSGTVQVRVTSPSGTSISGLVSTFTFYAVSPAAVSYVTPYVGPESGGRIVTISGSGFATATDVVFGATSVSWFSVASDGLLYALVPPGTGVVYVAVRNASDAASSTYPYYYYPAPTVDRIEPSRGPSDGGGGVAIFGSRFEYGVTGVWFGDTPASFSGPYYGYNAYANRYMYYVVATAPPGTGTVDVTVETYGGRSTPVPSASYTYQSRPVVTGLSRSTIPKGELVSITVTGSGFENVSNVLFGGYAASSFTVDSDTQLTAVTPNVSAAYLSGGFFDVTVYTLGGSSASTPASKVGVLPYLSQISQGAGPEEGGNSVTIYLVGLEEPTSVRFGAKEATFTSQTGCYYGGCYTYVAAVVPAGTGVVDVTVTTAVGRSAVSGSSKYEYVLQPLVTSITPMSGPGYGGTYVAIEGSNFDARSVSVRFGDTYASAYRQSDSLVYAYSPQGSGVVDVKVQTYGGTSPTSAATKFSYLPYVSSVSPSSGPLTGGTEVSLFGYGLLGATEVSFGSVAATSFTVVSANLITAIAPPGAGTVDIAVTTPGGTTSISGRFEYVVAPSVSSLSPSAGPASGGTTVLISGEGFRNASAVRFGASAATSFSVLSDTSIRAVAPSGAGAVDVKVEAPGGISTVSGGSAYSYIPEVLQVAPRSGPLGGGAVVTIRGAGFSAATAVRFGDAPASSFEVVSDTLISAVTPVSSGATFVVVQSVGGTSATGAFARYRFRDYPTGSTVSISTLAGSTKETPNGQGFSGDGGPASAALLANPTAVATDPSGGLLIADTGNHRVRRIDTSGVITTIAGGGLGGDGGPASVADLTPTAIAVRPSGEWWVVDSRATPVVRAVSPMGMISTVAGGGSIDPIGAGPVPATSLALISPSAITFDAAGNAYIADSVLAIVIKVDAAGVASIFAGTGEIGGLGDGGSAAAAQLAGPCGLAADSSGNLFVADGILGRVRAIDSTGTISTVAGSGEDADSGDGGPATAAALRSPCGIAVGPGGDLFLADSVAHRVRKVDSLGGITTVAGTGSAGLSGDGSAGTAATLSEPSSLTLDAAGNLFIADKGNNRVRVLDTAGDISTVVGVSTSTSQGFSGDGGSAATAQLAGVMAAVRDADGNVYLSDTGNHRIRKVSAEGTITSIAGTGESGYAGDGGAASTALLNQPTGLALDGSGHLFVADTGNSVVRRIDLTSGTISTIAGNGQDGFLGDGGPAVRAWLSFPSAVWLDTRGNLLIADTGNNRIRKVSASGVMTTIAGTGASTIDGDGGNAIEAALSEPSALTGDDDGNIYIADTGNHRIRRIDRSGIITTVAGNGVPGFTGDGGQAVAAELLSPGGVAVDADGILLISDTGNHRIRQVTPDGVISTVGGNGETAFAGDGGPAGTATLASPTGLSVGTDGALLLADPGHDRIRILSSSWAGPTIPAMTGPGGPDTVPDPLPPLLVAVLGLTAALVFGRRRPLTELASTVGAFVIGITASSREGSVLRPTSRRRLVPLLVCSASIGGLLPVWNVGAASAAAPTLKVLILGDSYSAGTGGTAYNDTTILPEGKIASFGCHRSQHTWGQQLAEMMKGYDVTVVNRACNGAVTFNMMHFDGRPDGRKSDLDGWVDASSYPDKMTAQANLQTVCSGRTNGDLEKYQGRVVGEPIPGRGAAQLYRIACRLRSPYQVEFVNDSYDIVVLTLGGNDGGFASIAQNCIVLPWFRCDGNLRSAEETLTQIADRVGWVTANIESRLNPAGRANPGRVLLADYPYLIDKPDLDCAVLCGSLGVHVGRRLYSLTDNAAELYKSKVTEVNVGRRKSIGAGGCSVEPVSFVDVRQRLTKVPHVATLKDAITIARNPITGLSQLAFPNNSELNFVVPQDPTNGKPDRFRLAHNESNLANTSFHPTQAGYRRYAEAAFDKLFECGPKNGLRGAPNGKKVLVFGQVDSSSEPSTVREAQTSLETKLVSMGYGVEVTQYLPSDLRGYNQIWHVGITNLPVTDAQQLTAYVLSGGSLYYTGEWGHRNYFANDTLDYLFTSLDLQVSIGGTRFDGVPTVNPGALDNIASSPNSLTTWTPSLNGSVSNLVGVSPSNVLFADVYGASMAAWRVGQGRLVVGMDINWLQDRYADPTTRGQIIENLSVFMSNGRAIAGTKFVPAKAVSSLTAGRFSGDTILLTHDQVTNPTPSKYEYQMVSCSQYGCSPWYNVVPKFGFVDAPTGYQYKFRVRAFYAGTQSSSQWTFSAPV